MQRQHNRSNSHNVADFVLDILSKSYCDFEKKMVHLENLFTMFFVSMMMDLFSVTSLTSVHVCFIFKLEIVPNKSKLVKCVQCFNKR